MRGEPAGEVAAGGSFPLEGVRTPAPSLLRQKLDSTAVMGLL